jgi:competence protein ComEC
MRRALFNLIFVVWPLTLVPVCAAGTLDVYFIDVEGGQATLMVSPSGESMLVDTGWPDANGRDADRIVRAAKTAGVKQIDYLVITHYHLDHVGGVPQLAARIPIIHFVDHGPTVEADAQGSELFAAYLKVRDKGQHILAKPGEKIPIRGLEVEVLTAAGREITEPLPGGGEKNAACESTKQHEVDHSENAQSVGVLVRFGKFRLIDLGDLTWNKELELACPVNRVGTIDVYLTTHHGMDLSGPPAIVHTLRPRVAVMNNGAKKGGSPEAWQAVRSSPGLEDMWQLHYAMEGGQPRNVSEPFIANAQEQCQGYSIKLSANPDGSFTVTNTRNGYSKTYPAM